jgi:hypothetical protein
MDSISLERKRSDDQLEHFHTKSSVFDEESTHWDAAFSKQTLRKVDFRVLPILAVIYSLALCASVLTCLASVCRLLTTFPSALIERILQMPISLVHIEIFYKKIQH